MRDPKHPRHFTDEFKRQIVGLHDAGKPRREIMEECDLGKSTLERWIKSINATGWLLLPFTAALHAIVAQWSITNSGADFIF